MTEKTENKNCLAGIRCPKCGALEPFDISARTNVVMSDDGSDPEDSHGDLEWDNDSSCRCLSCQYTGKVRDFRTDLPVAQEKEAETISLRQDSPNEYTLLETSVWISAKKMSVYIHKTDEGLCVDIYPLGCEFDGNGALGSTYVFDIEAEAAIEESNKPNANGLNDGEGDFMLPNGAGNKPRDEEG